MNRRYFLGLVGAAGAGLVHRSGPRPAEASLSPVRPDCYARTRSGACRLHWSVDTSEQLVALTFDDGPNPRYTGPIIDILARHGATATFFAIGANVEAHRGLARRVVDAGHEIANHTQTHPRLERLPYADVEREVMAGAAAIDAVTGQRSRWFRPPRGMVTGAVLAAAAAAGQDVAMWSVTRGGPGVKDDDDAAVLTSMLRNIHPGAILVLHDGVGAGEVGRPELLVRRDAELRALDRFLGQGASAGYRFVSLSELVDRAVLV